MEGISPNSCTRQQALEKKTRPQEQINCPRCNSTNTKFCYYNNYSLTQPRYFCKTCRRYWTEGGSLRNVPVGGGSRKNKKMVNSTPAPTPTPAPAIASSKVILDLNPPNIPHHHQNPNNKMMQGGGQDLNLAFPSMDQKYHHHGLSQYIEMMPNNGSESTTHHHHPNSLSALELLRSSMVSRGLSPYHPSSLMQSSSSSAIYPSGFPMQEVKSSNGLGFSVDHHHGMGNRTYDHHHEVQENNNGGGRVLFPFGEVKQHSSQGDEVGNNNNNNNKEQGNSSTGYWSGMIGEGSW